MTQVSRGASSHPSVRQYAEHINPAFVRLLGLLGYGRVFVRARGTSMWDHEGHEYLDFLAGFGAVNLGHNPPGLIAHVQAALADEVPNLLHIGPQVHAAELAAELARRAAPLTMCLFSSSGSEAVESALKLARAATRRAGIVYCEGGFHGTGLGALSVMGHGRLRDLFAPLLPECFAVPFDDIDALERALQAHRPAAFLVEPIQAEGGVRLPRAGYLAAAQQRCRRHGTLLMLDEIQTGLGRTGSLFAYQQEGFVPDVLCLGKALGGSLVALSATLTTPEIQRRAYGSLQRFDLHGSTFSGNALACRIGLATLRILDDEGLVERARARGERLLAGLHAGLDGHPLVRQVRGRGLLCGLELGPTQQGLLNRLAPGLVAGVSQRLFGQWLAMRLLERGIICQPASHRWDVLKLQPPLTVTEAEIDRAVAAIVSILGEYRELGPLLKDAGQRLGAQLLRGWEF